MEKEQKKRLFGLLKKTIPVLALLVGYYVFVLIVGKGLPCVFYEITGYTCPGCGISRMFMALSRFDFLSAVKYNILVLSLLPFILPLAVYKAVIYVKKGQRGLLLFEKIFYPIVLVLCIVFAIIRNMGLIAFIAL